MTCFSATSHGIQLLTPVPRDVYQQVWLPRSPLDDTWPVHTVLRDGQVADGHVQRPGHPATGLHTRVVRGLYDHGCTYQDIDAGCLSSPQGSWIVCCNSLQLKIEFRSCARGRQWCGIFHYYWWTVSIKSRLLFSPCRLCFLRTFSFFQLNSPKC